jgi:prevent-host-death family protein
MTTKQISAAEAKVRFSALLDDVQHHGDRYVVERHGKEVAVIVSVEDAERLRDSLTGRPSGALALLGLMADVADEDLLALISDLEASRSRDLGRPVNLEP